MKSLCFTLTMVFLSAPTAHAADRTVTLVKQLNAGCDASVEPASSNFKGALFARVNGDDYALGRVTGVSLGRLQGNAFTVHAVCGDVTFYDNGDGLLSAWTKSTNGQAEAYNWFSRNIVAGLKEANSKLTVSGSDFYDLEDGRKGVKTLSYQSFELSY